MNRTPDSILVENQANGTDLTLKRDEPPPLVQDLMEILPFLPTSSLYLPGFWQKSGKKGKATNPKNCQSSKKLKV